MTRVLSYNIRLGGNGHVNELVKMIRLAQPDIVGLVEATDKEVVAEIADKLGMEFSITGQGKRARDWQVAVLSRLPIIKSTIHTRAEVLTRKHLLEVQIEGTDGEALTVFVIHLTAGMYKGRESNRVRRAEVRTLLDVMQAAQGTRHLVMGDFNSLAPGDTFQASKLMRYMLRQFEDTAARSPEPRRRRRVALAAAHAITHSNVGGFLIDKIGPIYAQGGIDLLLKAGYVDCFRRLHPCDPGYTFPAISPGVRIDYLFASPELAQKLRACEVVLGGEGVRGNDASDHLPIWAAYF